jgi:hypothetical protein
MKKYWGSGGTALRILNLGTKWRWAVSFTPRPLYPRCRNTPPPVPIAEEAEMSDVPRTKQGMCSYQTLHLNTVSLIDTP